jgi:8-oxo-dGTP pyrophosphatase MutT (NUDIX family)
MNYAGAGFILLSPDLSTTLLVNDARSNKWGFPKGHREEFDTSDLETSIRELREETGLLPDDYVIYPEVFKVSKGSQSYNFRYAVLVDEKRKANIVSGPAHEIGGLQWVSIKQLLDAQNVLDGNKYLRSWLSDLRSGSSKKSVHLFASLKGRSSKGSVAT